MEAGADDGTEEELGKDEVLDFGAGNGTKQDVERCRMVQGRVKNQDDRISAELKLKIKEELRKVDHYSDEMETIRFLLQDVAGQSVFYDIHSIMLRLRSIFVLVVDLERPLVAKAEPLFLDKTTGKQVPIENYLVETNLDYAKRWMAALDDISKCHRKTEEVDPETEYILPATILVLTKSDKLQGSSDEKEKKISEVKNTLVTNFKESGFHSHIVATYVIDNTKSGNDEDDQIPKLRAKIFEAAQKILKAQDETPINWLRLERALSTVIESEKQPYIKFEKVREIGEVCEVVDKFSDAMKSFNEESIVVHFEGDKAENDLVVLDPSWLVELFTKIITVPPSKDCPGKRAAMWNDLEDNGKLDFTLLPAALEEHRDQKEALVKMMERTNLICYWKDNLYLVPSMVSSKIEKEQIRNRFNKFLKSSLYVVFESGYIPLGLFPRIQGKCFEWSRDNSGATEMPEFDCKFSRIPIQRKNARYAVILVRRISRIQVAIKGTRSLFFFFIIVIFTFIFIFILFLQLNT